MIENTFYQLSSNVHRIITSLVWLPGSANMSNEDFLEHCEMINNFINVYHTKMLFIDATDFKAKLDKSTVEELLYIKVGSSLRWIVYTSSNKQFKKLLQKLKSEDIGLIEHSSRNKLLKAYRELTND